MFNKVLTYLLTFPLVFTMCKCAAYMGGPFQAELMLLEYYLSHYIMVYLLVVLLMMCVCVWRINLIG